MIYDRYYLVLLNIFVASLTQSINQFVHPEDSLIEANIIFETLSLVCGSLIFLMGLIRIIIYHTVILRLDLRGKEKFLKKVLNSNPSKKGKNNLLMQMELNRDETESIESFTYKQDKKTFNYILS